jgi:hypothetical protein
VTGARQKKLQINCLRKTFCGRRFYEGGKADITSPGKPTVAVRL